MASLKDLRIRIATVKSTQKITSAMKMVAAAKLRRAQEQAEASRPYAQRMERMLGSLAAAAAGRAGASSLLTGTGKDDVHLLIVATADRGLCGALNSNIVRDARRMITSLQKDGKTVKLFCVGRKGRDQLRRTHRDFIVGSLEDVSKPHLTFDKAVGIAQQATQMFNDGEFDVCTVIYAEFKSAMTQVVRRQQLIPFAPPQEEEGAEAPGAAFGGAIYEFEPEEETILAELLPRNLAVQVFKALLENNASEQGARMTAMDSATRNAGEMINKLTLLYNRTRQAAITKELIEIVSAKEAM